MAINSARTFHSSTVAVKMPGDFHESNVLTFSSKRAVRGPGASQPSFRHSVTASFFTDHMPLELVRGVPYRFVILHSCCEILVLSRFRRVSYLSTVVWRWLRSKIFIRHMCGVASGTTSVRDAPIKHGTICAKHSTSRRLVLGRCEHHLVHRSRRLTKR